MAGQRRGASGDDLPGKLAALVDPVATGLGVDLVDVEVKGPPNRRVVRLVADADGGLDIDRIAALSRAVGDVIDDAVPGSYTLEVTSPGTDRPLSTARDFERNVGRDVRLQVAAGVVEPSELTGSVVEVHHGDNPVVLIDTDGAVVEVPVADVVSARVVLPW